MPTPESLPRLPEHLEAELLRFDASWNKPGVEQLRAAYPSEANDAYLLELIHIDAQKRVAAGLTAEEALYLEAFPVLLEKAALLQKVREITFTPMQTGDSVLRALAATTPVLHQVNLPAIDPQATTSESPSTLPEHRYKLEGEIARGGMGAVLRGRDEDLGREIAVKVMLQNHAGKTELLQRFVEEAQIAGQLQHPGITPVYELGRFPDQRPYFTMKLVRGQTLAKLLKDRAGPASERPRFLKIFEQICQTLAYAHTRKVIHRDLKPHNIMVGSFGEVQVMDWGLAKVLCGSEGIAAPRPYQTDIPEASEGSVQTKRSSGHSTDIPNTQAGSVLGTPAYMPPEQARGDIDQLDERADVFGLGAILCEILTAKPPYIGMDGLDIYRKAVNAELDDAYARLRTCSADAELISLAQRCLAAPREERPRDASVLTKELTSYLHSVEERLKLAELTAVQARTKAEEETKRRQVTIRLAAAILFTLLTGLAVSLWQMNRAMTAELVAVEERNAKELQRDKAIANELLARQERQRAEKEKAVAVAVKDFLQNKLLVQRDATQQANQLLAIGRGAKDAELDPKISVLLGRAAVELAPDKMEANFPQQPILQAELLETVGLTYRSIGGKDNDRYALAINFLERASELRKQQSGADDMSTLATLNNLAGAYRDAGNEAEALRRYEQISKQIAKKLGDTHSDTLTALNNLAQSYDDMGQHGEAIKLFEQVAAISEKHHGLDNPGTLRAINNLAAVYVTEKRLKEAIGLYEKVRKIREAKLGKEHPELLLTLNDLGEAYQAAGKLPEALRLFQQVRSSREVKLGFDHPDTLTTLNNLASVYEDMGRVTEAIKLFEQVRTARETKLGLDHPHTLKTLNGLAYAYMGVGKMKESLRLFEQIRPLREKTFGSDHPATLDTLNGLAQIYLLTGNIPEGLSLFERVSKVREAKLGADHPSTLSAQSGLAGAYRLAGRVQDSVQLYERVAQARITKLGSDHPSTLTTQHNLAVAYQAAGKIKEAIVLFEKVSTKREAILGPDHPDTMISHNGLASAYVKTGQLPKSLPLFEKIAANLEKRQFVHPNAAGIITNTVFVYEESQQFSQAELWLRKWLSVVKARSGVESADYAGELAKLGSNLIRQKKLSEAQQYLRDCLTIRQKLQPDTWTTFNTMSMLGGCILNQKKYADAEPLLLKGYEEMKQREKTIPTHSISRLPEALDRLIQLYTETNKPDEVKKWQTEKEKLPKLPEKK